MMGKLASQFGTLDGKDHFANFQHLSLWLYLFLPGSPRIMAMYDYASGTKIPMETKPNI